MTVLSRLTVPLADRYRVDRELGDDGIPRAFPATVTAPLYRMFDPINNA